MAIHFTAAVQRAFSEIGLHRRREENICISIPSLRRGETTQLLWLFKCYYYQPYLTEGVTKLLHEYCFRNSNMVIHVCHVSSK